MEPKKKTKSLLSKAYQYHLIQTKQLKAETKLDIRKIDQQHQHSPFASFHWALRGLYYAFRTQRNFRIELCLAAIAVALGFYWQLSTGEWSVILFSISQVLGAELANTSLEYMVDLYEKKFNYLALMAKDIASAFVLLSTIHAAIQGSLVFGPYLLALR